MTDLQLLLDAIEMKETDRVPSMGVFMYFPAKYCGKSLTEYLKNKNLFYKCYNKTLDDFPCDIIFPSSNGGIKICKALGLSPSKHYAGEITEENEQLFIQFEERKIMEAADYDLFEKYNVIQFLTKVIIPRSKGIPIDDRKRVKEATKGYMDDMLKKIQGDQRLVMGTDDLGDLYALEIIMERNIPFYTYGFSVAPFDILSFLFRGLENISQDVYRRPEKVKMFCEKFGKFINMVSIREANKMREEMRKAQPQFKIDTPGAIIFLERAFSLNPKKFNELYFPSLKLQVEEFVKNNYRPILVVEGDCTHLLEKFKELPGPNKCSFLVDKTEIHKVKEVLGDYMSILGNVPIDMLCWGTPNQIDNYCKDLIENVGAGGGFILGPALVIPDEAKPENVKAMFDSVHKYKPN